MTIEQNSAPTRDIPVPPGGGSWRFDEAAWKWVSNDPVPTADVDVADVPSTINTVEQEQ
jgi:hypothetical protein